VAAILIVDDQPQFRSATARLLAHEGHRTLEAADGSEALRLAATQPPDLVITDLFMPGIDGLEFIRALAHSHPGTSVIAVSGGGFMDPGSILAVARTLGALRTLPKPVDPSELLATVRELLGGDR